MANNTEKTYDLAADESTVLKFRGHPRYDAYRVENDGSGTNSGAVDVNVYVSTEDELDRVDTTSAAQVASKSSLADGYNFGSEASARTVLVELVDNGGTGASGVVYGHNANDPAQNGTAFANR